MPRANGESYVTGYPKRFQFSLRTMFVAMIAFAIGFAARNIATGVHPFTMSLFMPSSTTPVVPGDSLIVECMSNPSINRRITVLADETVTLPYVGVVSVSKQDTATIEKTLNTSYRRYIKQPDIQVYRADASQPLK
jgi:protein involved in polysaccharide export with SLBB domain